jgi:hypothetical protein
MIAETPLDGVSAIALVLIASFAIDRVVTGLLFGELQQEMGALVS